VLVRALATSSKAADLQNELERIHILRHPNLTQMFGYGLDWGSNLAHFVLTEQPHSNMSQFLASCSAVQSHKQIMQFARDVLMGLHFLHSKNNYHGSLNPTNLLLFFPTCWKVSYVEPHQCPLGQDPKSRSPYEAPELTAKDPAQIDFIKADVYSIAYLVLCYHLRQDFLYSTAELSQVFPERSNLKNILLQALSCTPIKRPSLGQILSYLQESDNEYKTLVAVPEPDLDDLFIKGNPLCIPKGILLRID
jgi:serine/threonine protein kinase